MFVKEDTEQAARRLKLSPSQVRRLCSQGRLAGAKKEKGVWAIYGRPEPEGRMHMGRPPTWG
jgi:hypothetical protein